MMLTCRLILCVILFFVIAAGGAVLGQTPVPGQNPPVQAKPNPAGATGQPQAGQAKRNEPIDHGAPAFQYAVALAATLGLLVIVCMPSRKR